MGYQTVREAEAAIQKFDGFDLGQGVRLKVALALAKQKPVITDLEEKEPTCVENGTTSNSTIESAAEGTPVRYVAEAFIAESRLNDAYQCHVHLSTRISRLFFYYIQV